MKPVSIHTAWWRHPGGLPDANFNFAHYKRFAQTLERGKLDALFLADHLAVLNMPVQALQRSATVSGFDPLVLLPARAAVTTRIGLIATGSTTYDEPFHVARRFAFLDQLSGGRAGWNVVTTSNPDSATANVCHIPHIVDSIAELYPLPFWNSQVCMPRLPRTWPRDLTTRRISVMPLGCTV
jgi:alkanesulfonate monooxygenase SsuD/methylene tetrahydromethanopterin reductase-like flavin-dependent oxidoreductase (luciferase family)